MTLLFLLVFVLLAAYAVYARSRHRRLKARCTEAFDQVYGAWSPRPGFEMSYSYGAPVFQVMFASRDDMTRAAADNDAFLQAIDAVCRDKGTKGRPFRAKKAIHFTHALVAGEPEPTPEIRHCCQAMRSQVEMDGAQEQVQPQAASVDRAAATIAYSPPSGQYRLLARDGDDRRAPIAFCPWCGSRLSAGRAPLRIG